MKNFVIFFAIFSFYSCGENWKVGKNDQPSKTESPPPVHTVEEQEPENDLVYKEIFIKRPVISEIYLGKFQEGDILKLSISGEKITPIFGPTTVKIFESNWSEQICINFTKYQCLEMPKKGTCRIRYRDYKESIDPIDFKANSANFKIKLKVGNKFYPIGTIIDQSLGKVDLKLKISKELLKESSDLYLMVIPDDNLGDVNTGFLGFDNCEGLGKSNFFHTGPKEMKLYKNQARRKYKVSVWLAE